MARVFRIRGIAGASSDLSKGEQEGAQITYFVVGEADAEPLVVEVDGRVQILRRAVMEIRRPRRQRAEDRSLEPADILPLAGDQRASRIGDLDRSERRRRVPERVKRQIGRAARRVGQADVERGRDRMIAGAWRVVTCRARSVQYGDAQVIVEALDTGDPDGLGIEQRLATG